MPPCHHAIMLPSRLYSCVAHVFFYCIFVGGGIYVILCTHTRVLARDLNYTTKACAKIMPPRLYL